MKPIIIYLDTQDGKIEITRKEFEKYISEAYQQGYDCGYAEGKKSYWSPYIYSNTTSNNPPITITTTPHVSPFTYNTQVTCDAHNDIGETK